MAAASATPEIIDLTISSALATPKPSAAHPEDSAPESNRRARRAKKRKAQEEAAAAAAAAEGGLKRKSPDTPCEQQQEIRKRKASPTPDPEAPPPDDDLFFVDVEVAPIPQAQPPPLPTSEPEQNTLLLPSHVTVFGSTPVEIIAPTTSLEDDSIQFLDYDDSRQFARYYQTEEQKAPSRIVCKKCGAENQHKSFECTVVICLTCGVRDEHPTRSCPISKVCFNCGMKGHISQKCPNRHTRGIPSSRFLDCERCYSSNHKTNECPTWWRMYVYLSDESRSNVLAFREALQDVPLGDGGEGYVASDEWCYYCGNSGHWGDDCPDSQQPPTEPSAFSFHNVASGPFYDPTKDKERSKKSRPRRTATSFLELEHVPDDVGRIGKEKAKSRLGKMLKDRIEHDDDQDDWFSRKNNGQGQGTSRASADGGFKKPPPTGPKAQGKSTFKFNTQPFGDQPFQFGGGSGGNSGGQGRQPSLLARIGDTTYQKNGSHHGDGGNGNGGSSKSSNKRKKDMRERQRTPEPDYRRGGSSNHRKHDHHSNRKDDRNNYDRRNSNSGGGGGGGPRYRGSYR